mmetsp:Transcript_33250/g.80379  ORF Transcript_33250/g.80379 Transcript_33250/m.80379 type:complete len:89 (+) Transcript_33250:270-536(+)
MVLSPIWDQGGARYGSATNVVLHTFQGHPVSGRCWELHINKILSMSDLQFKSATHDKCINRARYSSSSSSSISVASIDGLDPFIDTMC